MSDQKRIKIAEACGWKRGKRREASFADPSKDIEYDSWISPAGFPERKIPDYFADLNACHEMEKVIPFDDTAQGHWGYIGHLVQITGAEFLESYKEAYVLAHATAAQRAEAFGLTLGLWKEGEV